MTLADMGVLIDFLAGREPAAERVARELESGNLWTSVSTRFEMLSGARGARETRIVDELLDSMKIVPLDISAADRAAGVRRALERKGIGIGMADSLIAGIALHVGGTLLTRNRRRLARVEGLDLARLG